VLHHWYMWGSCKASNHRDINYKCFGLCNLCMGMYMICTNRFINKFLMGKLMNSCLYTRTSLTCILYSNKNSLHTSCMAMSKIDTNSQRYWQMFPTDTYCNKIHYTHIQQYNCYNNICWNMSNKDHNIYYKFQSHQSSIGWDMFVRIGHCINTAL